MQIMDLDEYRKHIYRECAWEEGIEVGMKIATRKMLERGVSLQEVAVVLKLSVDYLEELIKPVPTSEGLRAISKMYEMEIKRLEAECEVEEYRKRIVLRGVREEGLKEGLKNGLEKAAYMMMARGIPLLEVAETLGLPAERLQQVQPH